MKSIQDFHKFFQSRVHVLNKRPEQTVAMALSLPDHTCMFYISNI